MERIISDECLRYVNTTAYEAGRSGREVYTVRAADGPEVVRCQDCVHGKAVEQIGCLLLDWHESVERPHNPDGFCAWGRRDDGD